MYQSALGDFANEKAEAVYVEALRRMTVEQRWRAAFELWQTAVEFARAGVRTAHPDWAEPEVRAEVARRILETNTPASNLPGAGRCSSLSARFGC